MIGDSTKFRLNHDKTREMTEEQKLPIFRTGDVGRAENGNFRCADSLRGVNPGESNLFPMTTRISPAFQRTVMLAVAIVLVVISIGPGSASAERQPNVLLVITDDQGFSDVGFNGNPLIRTPVMDALAAEGANLTTFYAMPVCSPTRAALFTGRSAERTGVLETAGGRSQMHPEEWTLAEALRGAGYRTGLFGKWHLGDNFPMRPQDQGFDETVIHRAGMIGSEDSLEGERSYFDPVLLHNGQRRQFKGFCDDIFTDEAISFIREDPRRPFFVCYSSNLPHHPLVAKESDTEEFRKLGLSEETARFYGMLGSIDRNLGRLLTTLDELELRENTIVVFVGDNGTSSLIREKDRYEAGFKGRKGQVYEGGIRVPGVISWQGRIEPQRYEGIAAVTDVMPTLLAACGVPVKAGVSFDGVNLWPALSNREELPDRNIFIQYGAGSLPQPQQNFMVRNNRYKLVRSNMRNPDGSMEPGAMELYDMDADPFERENIASGHPEIVRKMTSEHETWFEEMKAAHGWKSPRIVISNVAPLFLAVQDKQGVNKKEVDSGWWDVEVKAGTYNFMIRLGRHIPIRQEGVVELTLGSTKLETPALMEEWEIRFDAVELPAGPGELRVKAIANGVALPIESVTITDAAQPFVSQQPSEKVFYH
jgi:arylsulfatase A